MKNYKGFIIAIKTNYGKNIAFYIPIKFEEIEGWKETDK